MYEETNQVKDKGEAELSPTPPAEVDESAVFETSKRLLKQIEQLKEQLKTARKDRDELEALIHPAVDFKLMVDVDNLTVGRMCTAGWKPIHMDTSPRPGIMSAANNGVSPVVVTVMFERIIPDRPTPPERKAIETGKADSKTAIERLSVVDDDEDEQTAARISHLPTYDKAELNRIAVMNSARKTQAMFRGFDRSPRPVDVVEGSLA